MNSSGKTVVITGADSGIGLAAALHFARQGWRVGLIGRGGPALLDAKARVEAGGGIGSIALADVSDTTALEQATTEIEAALGPLDVWVNNAGIGFYGKFTEVPEDAFRRVIDVNLIGTVNGTRIALARMRPRNRGTIVQILSAISYRGVPLQSAYSTSKYGLRPARRSLHRSSTNSSLPPTSRAGGMSCWISACGMRRRKLGGGSSRVVHRERF